MAIKEQATTDDPPVFWKISDRDSTLLTEAVAQREVNTLNSASKSSISGRKSLTQLDIVWLRDFKCFRDCEPTLIHPWRKPGLYRFYQELAPYGTLADLLEKYRYVGDIFSVNETNPWDVVGCILSGSIFVAYIPDSRTGGYRSGQYSSTRSTCSYSAGRPPIKPR